MNAFYIDEREAPEDARCGPDVVVLLVSGEIDYEASPYLRERVLAQVRAGRRHLVLDLSAVTFIDSTAIGVLVSTVTGLRATGGGSLTVVCSEENKRVVRIFDIVGVASLIALHRSCEEAIFALVGTPAGMRSEIERATTATASSGLTLPRLSRPAATRTYAAEGAERVGGPPNVARRGLASELEEWA